MVKECDKREKTPGFAFNKAEKRRKEIIDGAENTTLATKRYAETAGQLKDYLKSH